MRDGGGGRCAHCGAARISRSLSARRAEARTAIGNVDAFLKESVHSTWPVSASCICRALTRVGLASHRPCVTVTPCRSALSISVFESRAFVHLHGSRWPLGRGLTSRCHGLTGAPGRRAAHCFCVPSSSDVSHFQINIFPKE